MSDGLIPNSFTLRTEEGGSGGRAREGEGNKAEGTEKEDMRVRLQNCCRVSRGIYTEQRESSSHPGSSNSADNLWNLRIICSFFIPAGSDRGIPTC